MNCLRSEESRRSCVIYATVVTIVVIFVWFLSESFLAADHHQEASAKTQRNEDLELKLVHVVSDSD